MKSNKQTWTLLAVEYEPRFWQEPLGIPSGGVTRTEFEPLLEELFIRGWASWAWSILGKHWLADKRAFKEMDEQPPDGLEALARFCARHFRKQLPREGITQTVFWDEFMFFYLRAHHRLVEDDETLRAYVVDRICQTGWPEFLQRFVKILNSKESPNLFVRVQLCVFWDLFPMPLRYWADSAVVQLFAYTGRACNLDQIRNLRRELGLRRVGRPIVTHYLVKPRNAADKSSVEIRMDDEAARKNGQAAMLKAFVRYLKGIDGLTDKSGS